MKRDARAAVFVGAGQPLELRRCAVPDPGPGQVLVRVSACTLCGSDLHTYEGRRSAPVPTILGHEIIGCIEAFGDGAAVIDLAGQALRVGDLVTWSLAASCSTCLFCRRDLPQKCTSLFKYGHEQLRPEFPLSGGLAEYLLLVHGTAVLRLPEKLPLEVACPANCATATVAAALESAGELAGRSVLVFGAGMLGVTACAMARAAGAADIICADLNPARVERAAAFGAHHLTLGQDLNTIVPKVSGGHGVDIVLELSGSTDALETGLDLVRTGGTVVLVGAVFPGRPLTLVPERLVRRHLTLRGVHNYAPRHLCTAVRFLATAPYPFNALVAEWFPLADAEHAFQRARAPGALRVGVLAT